MMTIDPATGLVDKAHFRLSPNHDARPDLADISLLVIHGISLPPGKFKGNAVLDFFCNQLDIPALISSPPLQKGEWGDFLAEIADLRVSAHFFIRRTGELWQCVPLHLRAWHAGVSVFQGREKCNDFSIGIELEGTDEQPYDEPQYHTLSALSLALIQQYPLITPDRIVDHSDIAPGRKTDPGTFFDWQRYRELLLKT